MVRPADGNNPSGGNHQYLRHFSSLPLLCHLISFISNPTFSSLLILPLFRVHHHSSSSSQASCNSSCNLSPHQFYPTLPSIMSFFPTPLPLLSLSIHTPFLSVAADFSLCSFVTVGCHSFFSPSPLHSVTLSFLPVYNSVLSRSLFMKKCKSYCIQY